MKRMSRFLWVVVFVLTLLPVFSGGGSSLAAEEAPYRFHTEWAKLSAVDGRQLTPPVDKNTAMAVLWLLPSQGYHTYAHEPGDEGMPLTVTVLADGEPLGGDKVQIHYTAGEEVSLPGGGKSRQLSGSAPVFLVFRESPPHSVTLDISLLACSDQHCLPVHTRILLPTAPPELPNAANQPWFAAFLAGKACCEEAPVPQDVPGLPVRQDGESPQKYANLLPDAPTSVFQKKVTRSSEPAVPLPSAAVKNCCCTRRPISVSRQSSPALASEWWAQRRKVCSAAT